MTDPLCMLGSLLYSGRFHFGNIDYDYESSSNAKSRSAFDDECRRILSRDSPQFEPVSNLFSVSFSYP